MEMMEFDVYLAQKKKNIYIYIYIYFFTPYAPTNSTCINVSLVSQIILCLIYCNNNNIEREYWFVCSLKERHITFYL